ncbi:DinB family protein [candidate division KSB1 bacterium]|nr:DinB family protein [candidate division KSB1 bacterium]
MKTITEKIRDIVTASKPGLLNISQETTGNKKSPDSWSKKEILGHLIDSAANNHQRFVRGAQNLAADFPAYDQNRWVEIQHYNEMDWPELVELFCRNNFHLCRIIDFLPREVLNNPVNIGKENLATMEFVIKDYLRHLEHHIRQILGPMA